MGFIRPRDPSVPTRHLFLGNCGPKLGFSQQQLLDLLAPFDPHCQLHIPSEDASHLYVTFSSTQAAAAVVQALDGRPSAALGARILAARFADIQPDKAPADALPVHTTAEDTGVPGLQLLQDFISPQQEQQLLAAVDGQPWHSLAKRRVQHYGFVFQYASRGVDQQQQAAELPEWVQPVVQAMRALPGTPAIDQLTVNEYCPGVGLSPHIDTHSAFTGAILSLSLAGPCVMELRQQQQQQQQEHFPGNVSPQQQSQQQQQQQSIKDSLTAAAAAAAPAVYERRLLLLPPRSLLILGGEARYAWEHYIPHRKADWVNGVLVKRADRRVSLTFRETRRQPCSCAWPRFCDSQQGQLPPTRLALLQQTAGADADGVAGGVQAGSNGHGARGDGSSTDGTDAVKSAAVAGGSSRAAPGGSTTTTTTCPSAAEQASARGSAGAAAAAPAAPAPQPGATTSDVDAGAAALEAAYVHQVYDAIAQHFSATRFAVWPKVRVFIDSLPPWGVVADVGCGNGKYFSVRRDLAVLGCDRSPGLAAVAAQRLRPDSAACAAQLSPAADVFVADALELPYRPGSCDGVLCIAVLHHISTVARRVSLLTQLAAALRPGGRALVTVWASQQEQPEKTLHKWNLMNAGSGKTSPAAAAAAVVDQPTAAAGSPAPRAGAQASATPPQQLQNQQCGKEQPTAQQEVGGGSSPTLPEASDGSSSALQGPDYLVPWHIPFHRAGTLAQKVLQQQQQQQQQHGFQQQGQQPQPTDATAAAAPHVDRSKQAVVYQRYYHLFEEGELSGLVEQVPGVVLRDSYYDASNWCVIFERLA